MKKFLLVLSSLIAVFSLAVSTGARADRDRAGDPLRTIKDLPLDASRRQLLQLAFSVATDIPLDPFIKDRSRMQAKVVDVALQLDQPLLALTYSRQIKDFRQGAALADLAFYCATRSCRSAVDPLLQDAVKISKIADDWRRDNINVKVARVYALLGKDQKALELESGVTESETAKVAGAKALRRSKVPLTEHITRLDDLIRPGIFDTVRNALNSYVELYGVYYDKTSDRSLIESKIRSSWKTLPYFIRQDLLITMSSIALKHSDRKHALELADEAQHVMDGKDWPAMYRIPVMAQIIKARYLAGDTTTARTQADLMLALFLSQRTKIVNIDQAATIRPLAHVYDIMGDKSKAVEVYSLCLDSGWLNPNARPRAEDLAATLADMSMHGFLPQPAMMDHMLQLRKGLAQPW